MKTKTLLVAVTASLLVVATTPVYALVRAEPAEYTRSNLVQDVDLDQPISSVDDGVNHSEAINEMQEYIQENIGSEIFASIYIDWDSQATSTIVVSFTEKVQDKHQKELLALAGDSTIKFRIVDYNESELQVKQQEIDQQWAALETEGITVRTTGVNVYTNRVEVGIEPYEEQNIARVYELFGNEMVEVVQGYEIQMYTQGFAEGDGTTNVVIDTVDEASEEKMTTTTEEKKSIFQRIADFFRNLFKKNE